MATWAKGVDFKNSANTKRIGGIGIYGNETTAEKLYIGLGSEPWNNSGIQLTSSNINFKGNKIYHEGYKPTLSDIGAAAASHSHNVLKSAAGRITSANTSIVGDAGLRMYLATSSMTTGKPSSDGFILNFDWDTTAGWSSQMYIKNSNSPIMQIRGMDKGTWGSWYTLYSTNNKPTPAEIGAAASSHTHNYLPLSGGTVTGITNFQQGILIHRANNAGGKKCYLKIAQIQIKASYANQPIMISIAQRGSSQINTIEILFSNLDGKDPSLEKFIKTGPINAYIHKSATGVWDLYILKTEGYDSIDIIDYKKGQYMSSNLSVVWKDDFVDTLPSGNVAASLKTIIANVSGSSATLATARTIAIGNTGKSFNGSSNVSWSLSEIGAAASNHTHNYAGSSSAGGNANAAVKLAAARSINGTNFDGSGNITTANWGTARTITIGNTQKSVNGSANVSWSLAEIGAIPQSKITINQNAPSNPATGDLWISW